MSANRLHLVRPELPADKLDETIVPEEKRGLFFPARIRYFPYRRWILNILRSAHILCLCILVGGFFFKQDANLLKPWLIGTLISGLGIFLIDLYGSCIAFFEVRGISVLVKLGALGLLPYLEPDSQLILLAALIIFSSIVSHGAKRFRHWNFMPKDFQNRYGVQE